MMRVSSLTPKPENQIRFSYADLRDAPRQSGCYVLTVFNGTILYIGQARNIQARMRQHLDADQKAQMTPWGKAFWLHYILCPEFELNNYENGWNMEYERTEGKQPYFNKIRPPA